MGDGGPSSWSLLPKLGCSLPPNSSCFPSGKGWLVGSGAPVQRERPQNALSPKARPHPGALWVIKPPEGFLTVVALSDFILSLPSAIFIWGC